MTVDVEPQLKKRRMSDSAQNTSSSQLLVKRISEKARLPTRGSLLAAGYDLYRYFVPLLLDHRVDLHKSAEKKIIPARGKALIDTQLSIAVPVGTYGRVAPRSGLGTWFDVCLRPSNIRAP